MHFKDALSREGVNIIAEFKRASPSLGDIDVAADPVAKAKIYEAGGAAAMSVLCDAARFKGSVEDLRRVAASGAKIPLRVGREDPASRQGLHLGEGASPRSEGRGCERGASHRQIP